jgi:hypothetical protein
MLGQIINRLNLYGVVLENGDWFVVAGHSCDLRLSVI